MKLRKLSGLALVFVFLQSAATLADEMTFFEGGIDYWSESKPTLTVSSHETDPVTSQKPPDRPAFDWHRAMDPRNDDFFREGDYVPPAPFLEVARDPSDENIRMWSAYIARKNELAARLQQRLQEYSATHGEVVSAGAGAALPTPIPEIKPDRAENSVDPKRFRFRMYFDSECPHCQRMMGTLIDLDKRGFAVEALQVDERPIRADGLPFTVARASPDDAKRQGISSVPFLLVGDLSAKVVYKMTGYKSVSEIFTEIASANRGSRQ